MKIKYIVAIIILIIVVIVGGILAYDYYTAELEIINKKVTTDFDNAFMSGEFMGTVKENKLNDSNSTLTKWMASYKDNEHNIEYNMSTCKNATFLVDYLSLQGLSKPETREFGDMEWNIYYSQGVSTVAENDTNSTNSTNNTTSDTRNKTFDIYICEANKDNQSYLIYVINEKTEGIAPPVESDGSLYCELFIDYIEPLLEDVELKHNDDAPEVYDLLGIPESDYTQLVDFIAQYKAGEIDINGNPISN